MKKFNSSFLIATLAAGALLATTSAQAQLKITEVESSEAGGKVDGANKPDWFELSNAGTSAISLTGYEMDDDSDSFSSAVSLTGINSIAAGESVVFFENSSGFTVQDFIDWWGSSLSSVQIGSYGGAGVSLGGGGDQVNIFDSTGTPVDGVVFGSATAGSSFTFDTGTIGRMPTGVSQSGIDGAFTSLSSDIGSPGVFATATPEPSTFALAGGGLAALAGFRRLKNRKA